MQPGSVESYMMVVADVKAVREELIKRGAEVSEIDVQPWGPFIYFSDPERNRSRWCGRRNLLLHGGTGPKELAYFIE